jgi:hypothetical protein
MRHCSAADASARGGKLDPGYRHRPHGGTEIAGLPARPASGFDIGGSVTGRTVHTPSVAIYRAGGRAVVFLAGENL